MIMMHKYLVVRYLLLSHLKHRIRRYPPCALHRQCLLSNASDCVRFIFQQISVSGKARKARKGIWGCQGQGKVGAGAPSVKEMGVPGWGEQGWLEGRSRGSLVLRKEGVWGLRKAGMRVEGLPG